MSEFNTMSAKVEVVDDEVAFVFSRRITEARMTPEEAEFYGKKLVESAQIAKQNRDKPTNG